MKRPFLHPRMVGTRYEEASVPLDAFRELAGLEDLVLELARQLYLRDHQERTRVPRGFIEGFALHVSGVATGSAIPQIDRVLVGNREENIENERYYSRARDLILAVVAAAQIGTAIPVEFPADLLGRFDRIGRGLREDERIEFVAPGANAPPPAVLSRDSYKRLALIAATEYQAEADLLGRVTAIDLKKKTFTFSLLDGRAVPGSWTKETKAQIFTALNGCYKERQKVRVIGFAAFDANDHPKRFVEVLQLDPLDPRDVSARIEELKLLQRGWHNGVGEAPPLEGLTWIAGVWESYYPPSLPNPYVYPTDLGGLQLEWPIGSWEISAEIDLKGRTAVFVAVDTASEAMKDTVLDLAAEDGWRMLAGFVEEYVKTSEA